jgi:hypothetical protein
MAFLEYRGIITFSCYNFLHRKLAVPRLKVKPLPGLARESSIFAGKN